jgi:hypothetical protein
MYYDLFYTEIVKRSHNDNESLCVWVEAKKYIVYQFYPEIHKYATVYKYILH